MKMRIYIFTIATLLLSGCLSPVKTNPPATYVISNVPAASSHAQKHSTVLLVLQPDARPIYQTTQMAYTNRRYQVDYFSENKWAETPSQMLLPLLVQSLQNTNHFKAVLSPPYSGHYNYVLSTQILRFDQDLLQHPEAFRLIVRATLTRTSTGQLIASKDFAINVPLAKLSPYDGVVAANKATQRLLSEINDFVIMRT